MIYLTSHQGPKLCVLEPANIEQMKQGVPAISPDEAVIICWTPDMDWLAEQCRGLPKDGNLATAVGEKILASLDRKEVLATKPHEARKFVDTSLLHWEEKGHGWWDATIGEMDGPLKDGARFSLTYHPTCHRRGPYKLLIDVFDPNHTWGCFDEQDGPMRLYHSKERAQQEAEAIARVLTVGRKKSGK